MRLTRLLYSVMATMLLSAAVCYSNNVDNNSSPISIVDATPKSHLDYINALSTATLAIFTIVLVGATIYYAIQTKRLLNSNRELIELNKAQNSIAKSQLLSKIDELISNRRMGEGFPLDSRLGVAIRAYLNKSAIDLLGEGYTKKVTVRLRSDYKGTKPIFNIQCEPGKHVTIPMIVWERLEEVDHDFEVIDDE